MPVDCFPEAPTDWPRKAFGSVAEVNPPYKLDKTKEYPFVEMAAVGENFRGIQRFDRRKPESSGLARFKLNDILFAKITPSPENGKVALVNQLPDDYGLGSTEFIVLSPRNGNDPRFVYALACSNPVRGRAIGRMEGSTGRLRVTEDTFRKWLRVSVPPPAEQKVIAAIFDACDAARSAIEAKLAAAQRLKTALMQQLFTRGIPGRHTRFKQTKIGLIPEEWDVITLGSIADIDAGVALNPDREPRRNGYRYLTVVNVQRERIDLTEIRHLELWDSEIPGKLLREGDIVAVEGHANSSEIGRAAMVTSEADGMAYQNHLFRVRLRPDVDFNTSFLLGCMNSERVRRHWNATANTSSGLNTINRRGLRKLRIPQPRRGEQDDIVALIDAANSNIRAAEDELQAVRRLKTSLLQNLLTGKVRIKMED
jgi:type I restriction enzyme S subunit